MKKNPIFILLFLCLCAATLQAQEAGGSFPESDLGKLLDKDKSVLPGMSTLTSIEQLPVERAVNPETYRVGAGDLLAVNLVQPMNLQYVLPVSADGSLMIPRVGAIPLREKTLRECEQELLAALGKKYPVVKGTLSLFRPRAIYVQVSGDVEAPGLYTVTSATPVSVALAMASVKKEETAKSVVPFAQPGPKDKGYYQRIARQVFGDDPRSARSFRRVFIRRAGGEVESADLVRYAATRDERANPMLREGDEILVPPRDPAAPTVGIFGAVRKPGEYEFVEGDNVALLVRIGMGVNRAEKPAFAEIVRRDAEGRETSLPLAIEGIENNETPLQPGDRLLVKGSEPRALGGKAAVRGEVNIPGVYPITPGKTMLTDLVKMAGGFTASAWPGLCEMYRPQIGSDGNTIDLDREWARNLHLSLLTLEDTLSYRLESRMREGAVSVDFHRLFTLNDAKADVPVYDGDMLLVPRNTMSVQVIGMVANGGFIPWVKDEKLDYYIARAGGYLEDASTSRVRIVKGNTRAWVEPGDTQIEPGDIIWVHRQPQVRASNTSEVLGVLASIIAGVAGIASLMIQVLRK